MKILALDVGSSSVKAAILRSGKIAGPIARAGFPTRYDGLRVEVEPHHILKAIAAALADLGAAIKRVETIGLTAMSPSWCAMDHEGRPLTPIITHQDRRSVDVARQIEKRLGKQRHLRLAGNRPIPGGVSSTTWAWFIEYERALMKRADLCGHLTTYLHRQLTHGRVTDPSNAGFMGLYGTLDLSGWNDELIDAAGVSSHQLPQVLGAEEIGGLITRSAATRLGLTHGTPLLAGCMDGSAAMLLAGNKPGRMVNVCGSTDVLALCTDRPRPHENLLTRPVGVGKRWVSVSTMAAAGSALLWAHQTFFRELDFKAFLKLVARLSRPADANALTLRFDNWLAGSRTSLEQHRGSITGLTLSTTREDILTALADSLARDSAARIDLLKRVNPIKIHHRVLLTGGASGPLADLLHRDWPGLWTFYEEDEATLRGVAALVPG